MKGVLEFNLDDGEDRIAHLRAVKSTDLALTIHEMDEYLRGRLKHGDLSDLQHDEVFGIREKLNELLLNYNICLDELLR